MPLSCRRNEHQVAAQPADAARVGADLEPIIFSIEDIQFSAVMHCKRVWRFVKRAVMDHGLASDDNGDWDKAALIEGRGETGAEFQGGDGQSDCTRGGGV